MNRMVEVIIPLRMHAVAMPVAGEDEAGVVEISFGDEKYLAASITGEHVNFTTQQFEKGLGVAINNAVNGIQAERVDVKSVDPLQGVLHEEVHNLVTLRSVEVEGLTPWSPVLIGEIRPEIGQVVPFRTQVVVDDVEHDGHPALVASVDYALQCVRASVTRLHGKWKHSVVTPITLTGELRHGHNFQCRNAELLQVV